MMMSDANYKEKIKQLTKTIEQSAAIVGMNGTEADGTKYMGLGLDFESKLLLNLSEDLKKGIFKVLTMGEFKNGKSTLLNAVIGNKILPANAIATTAVITILVYGTNSGKALVYMKNQSNPIEMTIAEFNDKFKLTPEDETIIGDGGNIDRFADVEYALIECNSRFCENGVRLIDSPGLGEADTRSKTTMKFVPSANAIIFVLNATHLFSKEEKKYIRDNFSSKNLQNVFFVVNRINQINDDIDEVKNTTKFYLKSVFTDETGIFDEELYNNRVFYLNAYGALQSKQNGEESTLNNTDFHKFENALEKFLLSDDKAAATFQSNLNILSGVYVKAEQIINENKNALQLPLEELEKKYMLSDEALKEAEQELKKVRKAFKRTADVVKAKVYESLWSYIEVMEASWESDMGKINHKISPIDMLKLAATMDSKKRNEIITPLVDELKEYITDKLEIWSSRQETLIEPEIRSLMEEINASAKYIDIQLQKATMIFSGTLDENETFINNGISGGQLIISLIFFDPSMLISGAAAGGFSWAEFFRKSIVQYLIQWVVFGLFTGGLAWIVFFITEAIQVKLEADKMTEKLLTSMKTTFFIKLKETVSTQRSALDNIIQGEFDNQLKEIDNALECILSDERNRQNSILEMKKNEQVNIDEKTEEYNKILSKLFDYINDAYYAAYGSNIDIDGIKKMSASI